jgi:hypothetical protein
VSVVPVAPLKTVIRLSPFAGLAAFVEPPQPAITRAPAVSSAVRA